jgi:hypothetical protein
MLLSIFILSKSIDQGAFENRVLRRLFGPKRDEGREAGEDCIMRSFINFTLH